MVETIMIFIGLSFVLSFGALLMEDTREFGITALLVVSTVFVWFNVLLHILPLSPEATVMYLVILGLLILSIVLLRKANLK